MSSAALFALLPLITLSVVILVLMLVIAFNRNLALTCGISVAGCLLTLVVIYLIHLEATVVQVTPLLIVDDYALLFSALIVLVTGLICLISYDYHLCRGEQQDEFYLLMLLSALGGMTLAHSNHFASMILGLELLGIALYAMISYPTRGLLSLEAGLKYLILSGVSSAFILFGVALLFAAFGTLSFPEIKVAESTEANRMFILLGSGLILSGIGFKLSLVPFHMWTPDVYQGAPAPTTAFLATVSKGAIFAVLLRFFISLDGYQYATIMEGLFWLSLLSILVGNLLALMQTSIKRLLAYSSIAHLGYLLVAFLAASYIGGKALAVEAALFFLLAYFLTTVGAFGVVTLMSQDPNNPDNDDLKNYQGLFWRRPLMAAFFTAMLLSLAGIPLTAGFVGKFYIFAAGVQTELWVLLAAVVVGSGIGLFYYLRIIFTMTKQSQETGEIVIPVTGGWALAVVTLSMMALGVYPAPVISWINNIARSLI
jgi:NADH-quinone oxidoreductase subunit N